jgi:hypothetical protein
MRSAAALIIALLATAPASHAQAPAGGRAVGGTIAGLVVDVVSGAALEGADVVLEPDTPGLLAGDDAGSFAPVGRTLRTAADGVYRFDGLPAGAYRVAVARIGYRPYSIVVELRGAHSSAVSIGLVAEPIALAPLRPLGQARGPYEMPALADGGGDVGAARVHSVGLRRHMYLSTDVRELTSADVTEAVTLGEPDLFRALQRLPGVTTRSDFTAELWTRGAAWQQTRVYFDGVPLYNPLHALGVVSGVGSNAVSAVWFHPGARPAELAEGAAGVVDLRSRSATGHGEVNMQADLSLMTAGLALDQRVLDGRAGWALSGRRTYLDWLSHVARRATGSEDTSLPYGFSEITGRIDAAVGEASAVSASWLWERDYLADANQDGSQPLHTEWGNAAARLSLSMRHGRIASRHTVGVSGHDGVVRSMEQVNSSDPLQSLRPRLVSSAVEYAGVSGSFWTLAVGGSGPRWTAGYSLERQRARYAGPQVLPVPRRAVALESVPAPGTISLDWRSSLPLAALWAERTWGGAGRLTVRTGLRADVADGIPNASVIRPAPRLAARYELLPELSLSAGYSRVYQYAQALAPTGVHVASLTSTDVWVVAGPGIPAVRSDIATAGLETWLAPGQIAALNVFARHASGIAEADPRPGPVFGRPSFLPGENVAYGVELSVRQLVGRVTGSMAYSLSRSEMTTAGLTYPASSDRRHVFSGSALARTGTPIRIGAAFTAASGVPYARVFADSTTCAGEPGCDPAGLPWMSEPNAERAPAHASLDLLLDWNGRLGGLDVGAYVQLRNALGRENVTVYTGNDDGCSLVGCGAGLRSTYERGVPRLPVIGIRVRR